LKGIFRQPVPKRPVAQKRFHRSDKLVRIVGLDKQPGCAIGDYSAIPLT
jgi:hypothetical protein